MGNSTIVNRGTKEQGQCISVKDIEGICFLILLCYGPWIKAICGEENQYNPAELQLNLFRNLTSEVIMK